MPQLQRITEIDAHGGPVAKYKDRGGNEATPTRAGRYIIGLIDQHVTQGSAYPFSRVPWGAALRTGKDGAMEVNMNGGWKKLSAVVKTSKYFKTEKELTDYLKDYYASFKYKDGKALPDRWVFNDFGHITIKYFRDLNGDRVLNKGRETFMSDFIHTTPYDEAYTAVGKKDFVLEESHGCIHLRPADIDSLISKRYLKRGNTIEIHPYTDKVVPTLLMRKEAKPFFEFHVFPGINKAAVYSVH
ncbi:hypothetical protein A8C56_16605 [Niabella ginsenosidivorans]|uniref:YkuD domain-containing protein n=1 Tax=Niabella ginsenosidivorans TaxID=1176587 RepID=A0A1A9I3W5_9BACT|nr:L,D-transpeptidase [Niabella ginsenosidivorans]ANH82367.1 hypothetical protein A8C56_16605 [Niabella ginsenosidivorans]